MYKSQAEVPAVGVPREYIDPVFTRLLSPSYQSLLAGLSRLPSQCAVCLSWPSRQVCPACIARFTVAASRCCHCALALPADLSLGLRSGPALCGACMRERPPTDVTLVAVTYAYPWSRLIASYKFGEQPGWAAFFAGLLCQAPGVMAAFSQLEAPDWVVPLPLSAERLQSRGFNQTWELARALATQTATSANTDARLLLRVKNTRPQSQLKRDGRLANVKGAFQVDPLRAAELEGRRVILVDDVMTSGATVFTAARALKDAGARQVTAVVLARTAAA